MIIEKVNLFAGNYPDFGFSETEEIDLINTEISLFLNTQSREHKLHIYRDYMTSYGVIEDLMCLDFDERLELVIELRLGKDKY